jgi:creatinine amidohydrolase
MSGPENSGGHSVRLGDQTWRELEGWRDAVGVMPTGAIEQHGPHLPLAVDALLVERIAEAAAQALEPGATFVCPTLPYGYSVAHLDFCGTFSLAPETYLHVSVELGESLFSHGFRRLLFLNGHGGNVDLLKTAARTLRERGDDRVVAVASYWQIAADSIAKWRRSGPGGVSHACEMETSLMLHLFPAHVRREQIEDHIPAWTSDAILDDLQGGGRVFPGLRVADFSPTGTVGTPSLASAERGQDLFEQIVTDVHAFLADFRTWEVATMVDTPSSDA